MSIESTSPHEIASPGLRFCGAIIDGIAVSFTGVIVGLVAGGTLLSLVVGSSAAGEDFTTEEIAAMAAAGGFVGSLFGAIIGPLCMQLVLMVVEGLTGSSPGKVLLGMTVANADGSTRRTGPLVMRAAVKHSPSWLIIVATFTGVSVLMLVGQLASLVLFFGLFAIFGQNRQTLYDMIAGTEVVKI